MKVKATFSDYVNVSNNSFRISVNKKKILFIHEYGHDNILASEQVISKTDNVSTV